MNVRLLLAGALFAAVLPMRAADPAEVLLWPNGAPGSEGKTASETVRETDGIRRIASIHKPSITPWLPARGNATGAAVIILPGGGHQYLSIDNEGHFVAKWLSEHGVAAFVLKYRLAREEGSTYKVDVEALHDTQRALRLVRSRAREWSVDPERIGIMGFSAGGQLAAMAGMRFDRGDSTAMDAVERETSRPAFQALIYPGGVATDATVPKDAPPAFLCAAYDDRGPAGTSLTLTQKFRDAGINAELHLFSKGGHGFGMRDRPLPITSWIVRLHEWMKAGGFLTPISAVAQ
jgi:acetyl esterase/lipase